MFFHRCRQKSTGTTGGTGDPQAAYGQVGAVCINRPSTSYFIPREFLVVDSHPLGYTIDEKQNSLHRTPNFETPYEKHMKLCIEHENLESNF